MGLCGSVTNLNYFVNLWQKPETPSDQRTLCVQMTHNACLPWVQLSLRPRPFCSFILSHALPPIVLLLRLEGLSTATWRFLGCTVYIQAGYSQLHARLQRQLSQFNTCCFFLLHLASLSDQVSSLCIKESKLLPGSMLGDRPCCQPLLPQAGCSLLPRLLPRICPAGQFTRPRSCFLSF